MVSVRPNPFNPSTTISYTLDQTAHAELVVFDAAGRRVAALVNAVQEAGPHAATWDGRTHRGATATSGVYFARLRAAGVVGIAKLVLLK